MSSLGEKPAPPTSPPVREKAPQLASHGGDSMSHWADIIRAVKTPLALFAMVILAIVMILSIFLWTNELSEWVERCIVSGMLGLLFVIVISVVAIALVRPEVLGIRTASKSIPPERILPLKGPLSQDISDADKKKPGIIFEGEAPAKLDYWYREMQPLLHQAAHYSVPIYYLDTKLRVMDWNVAFEVVFADLAGEIRGKHVNTFINRMANYDGVYNHAKEFTRDVIEKGAFPYVDMEPIHYESPVFGLVKSLKVASQLTDRHGISKGWAVALLPTEINWPVFQERLQRGIHDDKMWSVYSASYDRVLRVFPPYKQLIQDVISVIPCPPGMPPFSTSVADIGCGTGNVSAVLLERKFRVTAIENNVGMLDRFVAKRFDAENVKLIKSSVEHLDFLEPEKFDAAVMVNVLYALDQPVDCLRSVSRALRPNGVLGLSTTHRDTNLEPLLKAIEKELKQSGKLETLATDWENVHTINKGLEETIVKRHTREQIREMVTLSGFDIINEIPSAYHGAVTIIHARKANSQSNDSSHHSKSGSSKS